MLRYQSDPKIEYQVCECCGNLTGRCEEDSLYYEDHGPLCSRCLDEYEMIEECLGDKND